MHHHPRLHWIGRCFTSCTSNMFNSMHESPACTAQPKQAAAELCNPAPIMLRSGSLNPLDMRTAWDVIVVKSGSLMSERMLLLLRVEMGAIPGKRSLSPFSKPPLSLSFSLACSLAWSAACTMRIVSQGSAL